MKLTLCLTAAAAVALALAACSSSPPAAPATSPAASPSAAPSSAAPAPAPATPSATPTPVDTDGTGRIGGVAVTLPSGFVVSVGKPTRYPTASDNSGVARTGNVLTIYPVTVKNTSDKRVDMTLTAVNAYADGEQVDGLDDTSHPTDDHFTGMLLPGRAMKATFGFLTRKGDEGTMQVEVYVGEAGGEPAVFTDGNGTT